MRMHGLTTCFCFLYIHNSAAYAETEREPADVCKDLCEELQRCVNIVRKVAAGMGSETTVILRRTVRETSDMSTLTFAGIQVGCCIASSDFWLSSNNAPSRFGRVAVG